MTIAFDTAGLHPSTEASLRALEKLQELCEFRTILDVGCGNGILSVASAHIWDATVIAADISENALRDAQENIAKYGLESRIRAIRSDIFANSEIAEKAPYDLIIANLLAEWLLPAAMKIKTYLKPNGYCILSGILAWQAEGIETGYKGLGFEIIDKIDISPWRTYIFCNRSET